MKPNIFASLISLIMAASASLASPIITGVSFSGSPGNYTLTVSGSGFGSYPGSLPFSGDSSYFRIADAAQIGFGEWGYTGDAYGLTYNSWSDSQIVVSGFGGEPGDAIILGVWNPNSGLGATWGGNVPGGSGEPQITSVTFSGSGQNLQMIVQGSGFGNAPVSMPYTGNLNYFIFDDARTQCTGSTLFEAGTTAWGHRSDSVTLVYESWSDTEIVIDGFAGSYGQGCATVQNGDPVTIEIWNTSDTSQTGPQTAWGGIIAKCSGAVDSYTALSSDWSGYVVGIPDQPLEENGEYQSNTVTDVKGTWTVPGLGLASVDPGVFATWVGIGGWAGYPGGSNEDTSLVQIGIAGYSFLGKSFYFAWYESIPGPPIPILNFPVNAGDKISAEVSYIPEDNAFFVMITDLDQPVSNMNPFGTFTHDPNNYAKTAEWIVEYPTPTIFDGLLSIPIGSLADFGTNYFTNCSVTLNSEPGSINSVCGAEALGIELGVNERGGKTVAAYPVNLSSDGSSFSVAFNPASLNLVGANLRNANLQGANLQGANLTFADLQSADLANALLQDADLKWVDLFRADLSGANLTGANLSGADLQWANLQNANFTDANLSGADLRGAITTGAIFTGAITNRCIGFDRRWREHGFSRPDWELHH